MLGRNAPQSAAVGQLGAKLIDDTTACTGAWGEIYCLSAATFTTLTTSLITTSSGGTVATGMGTMAANTYIKGYFTAITLATGKVIAYNV